MEWNMDIVKAEFVVSNATVEKCPKPDRHEYAFIVIDQYADEQ